MEIRDAGVLVPGATGVLGSALASRPHAPGASVTVTGRDRAAPARVSRACGDAPASALDAVR